MTPVLAYLGTRKTRQDEIITLEKHVIEENGKLLDKLSKRVEEMEAREKMYLSRIEEMEKEMVSDKNIIRVQGARIEELERKISEILKKNVKYKRTFPKK